MDALANAFADASRSYSAASKAVASGIPARLTSGMGGGLSVHASSLNRAAEQYEHYSGWVYVGVKAIASKIAAQSISVGRIAQQPRTGRKGVSLPSAVPNCIKSLGERVEPLESHEFLTALQNPNPVMVPWSLIYSTVANLLLTGRSHWWLTEQDGQLQIWPLPSTWIEPANDLRTIWKIRPPGFASPFDVPASDVVPFSLPDPSSPFAGGVSPLQSQAMAVSTDEEIQSAQFRSFQNGVFPGVAYRVGKLPGMAGQPGERPVLDPQQRQELTEAVLKMHGGLNRNAPLIIDGMIEGVDRLTVPNSEMDYMQSAESTKNRILMAFGVSPAVVGQLQDANRASAYVAAQNFAEATCNPLIELLSQTLSRWVGARFSADGQRLVAWIEPVRADDPEMKLQEWKAARAAGDVTPNEFRKFILNLPAVENGDTLRDQLGNPIGEAKAPRLNGHALRN